MLCCEFLSTLATTGWLPGEAVVRGRARTDDSSRYYAPQIFQQLGMDSNTTYVSDIVIPGNNNETKGTCFVRIDH